MKKLQYLYRSVGFVCIIALAVFAKEPDGTKNTNRQFQKSSGQPSSTLLNINRISSWYESNGTQENNPSTGNSGLTYPRGTSTVLYSSGLMWGGYSNDAAMPSNQPRVSGQSYNAGTSPGAILGYRTGVTEDPTADDVRIWRIRRDYATADLKQDAAEINSVALSSVSDGQIGAVRTQYATDWKEWPWKKGAPFYDVGYLDENLNLVGANNKKLDWGEDVNMNAVLDAGEDVNKNGKLDGETPGAADADQVIWYVANDIRAGDSPWKTKPLGLEMQVTIWGYNRTDALGNMLFKKFKLIYKGHATTPANGVITDMYLCQWSDPDLGDAGDDYAGCDVALSLGYVYNSTTLDREYRKFNIAPPAAGFDFLQGPIVASAGDTAVFDLKYRPGYRNMPMTSFIYFAAGGNYSDPPFSLNGSWQWYSMFLGGPPTPQPPPFPGKLIDPKTNDSTTFWLSGNPEDNNNPNTNPRWIDGLFEKSGDRRILLTAGPFNMALGDTQELVSSVIAGVGSDYISSIKVLKFYDKTTQAAYNNLFNLPKPPPQPKFTYVELDKGIILEWEKDSAAVAATEGSNSKGFLFEGYNIYQLPSATSPLSNAKKLVTYDLPTDPATVSQDDFDEASGQVLTKPVQLGKNTGLTRYMYITKDEIKNQPLVNGQQYYFAVTAYNYNPDPLLVTKSFESTPNVAVITPHQANPGVVYPYKINDVITAVSTQESGDNDATLGYEIFNPTLQTGGVYEVWYGGSTAQKNYTIVQIDDKSTDMATVTAVLRDTNQVPRLNTRPNSKGFGQFTLNDAKNRVKYRVGVTGLSGPVTSAVIAIGERTTLSTAGITVHTLASFNSNGVSDSSWSIPDSLVDDFTAGNLYVNVRTAAQPNGEIRDNISTGLFPRTNLAAPFAPPAPALTTYTAHRLPNLGLNFYVAPWPVGPKSVQEVAPTTGSSVVDKANPSGSYSIRGPLGQLAGSKPNEINVEIRFVAGTNWAITAAATPPVAKFIRVPFAVYKDTIRVMPVIANTTSTDTVWNTDPANGLVNGKPVFDMIAGVCDNRDGANNDITYYAASNAVFPPTSNAVKGRYINGANHILKNITIVNESGNGVAPAAGTSIRFAPNKSVKVGDRRRFQLNAYKEKVFAAAKTEVSKINVFPNPYYAVNSSERRRETRYITFSHLPEKATIRIFNLAGTLVTTLEKNSTEQFFEWDLTNHKGLPVASGIYLVHIDMGDLGVKILKSAIIMEQQFLDNF
jgi:hypothetical protein